MQNRSILTLLLIFVWMPGFILAGISGKIAGKVTDAKTGEPLPGCNIMIVGTTLGAAGNSDGEFFIINVPPGEYQVRATMMGYHSLNYKNVQVMLDLTTRLDFALTQTVLELGEEVTIVAERPLVQKDITSKLSVVNSQELTNMPVSDFQDVLITKAGFTRDADGEIHVRGGRSGEISYLIDGMIMQDPLYGGFKSMVNEDAIDEMVVLSGTFNAEYGNAMSSVVNIVTKEGDPDFSGKLEYTSPMLNESPYRKKNPFGGVLDSYEYIEKSIIDDLEFKPAQLKIPLPGMLNSSLSGPVPLLSKMYFFASGRYKNEDSYLPHGYSLEKDGLMKLTYRFNPELKLTLSAQQTWQEYQPYRHAWKYRSEFQEVNTRRSSRNSLNWTHTLSQNLFYTVILSRFTNSLQVQVADKQPEDYVIGQTGETVYFYIRGDGADYADDLTTTWSGKFDVTCQANIHHQFKGGLSVNQNKIEVYEESEPWPGGAQYQEEYTREPLEFSAYLQDKIEYNYLIVNLGFRYDYADPKTTMWPDVRRFGEFDAQNNWIPAAETKVDPGTQLSPRIGLAHPITDRAVLHFSYGHFFQNPDYNALYYNHHKDLSTSLPLVGNPRLKAQKTVAYETGIKYQLSENWALDLTAWYKDITDLLSTLQISYLSQDYVVFYNSDYASVTGIDLTLRKKYNQFFSGSIDYSFMVAKGNNSQPLGGYVDAFAQEEIPHQEYFLDFDQRHDLALNFNLSIPEQRGLEFRGRRPFANFSTNFLIQIGSGLPYTPYVDPALRVEINSARKPWTSTVDLRMIKKFNFPKINPAIFLEITNLFDSQNVVQVYSRTGKPFDTGLPGLVGSSPDADHNPSYVGPPRIIKAGLQLLW